MITVDGILVYPDADIANAESIESINASVDRFRQVVALRDLRIFPAFALENSEEQDVHVKIELGGMVNQITIYTYDDANQITAHVAISFDVPEGAALTDMLAVTNGNTSILTYKDIATLLAKSLESDQA